MNSLEGRSQPTDFQPFNPYSFFLTEYVPQAVLGVAAAVPILISAAILIVFVSQAWFFFQEVSLGSFLTDIRWTPLFTQRNFGILVIASATMLIAAIATLVAVPLGLLAAIYLSEIASPGVRRILKPTLEALAGIPTVVYGYFALLAVTPFLKNLIPGIGSFNALSAGLVTGVLITPIISSIGEDAMRNVPEQLRQGGYALGFTQREVITQVVLPVAFPGIMAAITLAVSRALGETMIAAIAAGQNPRLTLNPFIPVESMTAFIVQVSLGDVPTDSFIFHTIFTVGLVLFLLTLSLNWLGHWLVYRHRQVMLGLTIPKAESRPTKSSEEKASEDAKSLQVAVGTHPDVISPLEFDNSFQSRSISEQFFSSLSLFTALLGLIVFGLLLLTTLRTGLQELDWHFLTSFSSRNPDNAGILAALSGTLWLLGLTALFVFPIGVAAAIYLEEYLPDNAFSRALEIHIANLSAVPSILYGLLGLALFVRAWSPVTAGRSILSGALVLTVIVLPLVIIATRSALRGVSDNLRHAGYATGMTRWQMIFHVILPAAFPNIVTGMLLALSRAVGETAPLLAIGAVAFVSFAPEFSLTGLRSNFTTLPTQIFHWAARPQKDFQDIAAAAIIVLGGIVLLMNITAVLIRDQHRKYQ
jgi:phosphate transport system permease protein